LDQIAKQILFLSEAPSYWFTLNTSCDHAFHLSKRLGMDESDYKALLIAGNLARYKGRTFITQADEWKSFLVGHHLFTDLPSDQRAFQFGRKRCAINSKRQNFHVIRIGQGSDMSPRNFESQLKMDRLPLRNNSLRLQQQKFCRDTELAIAHVHVDLFVGGAEDSLPETAPPKSLAPQMGLSNADPSIKIVGVGISDVELQMYPILAGIYGDEFDSADHKTLNSVRSMLLEIMHLLDASRGGLEVTILCLFDYLVHLVISC
jgi:hypothetical protein